MNSSTQQLHHSPLLQIHLVRISTLIPDIDTSSKMPKSTPPEPPGNNTQNNSIPSNSWMTAISLIHEGSHILSHQTNTPSMCIVYHQQFRTHDIAQCLDVVICSVRRSLVRAALHFLLILHRQ
ncbi:hypothetical protein Droror1_Dr00012172 [Drosera rotundifolia]